MKDGSRTHNEDGRDEEKRKRLAFLDTKTQHPLTNGFSSPDSTLIANRNLQCRKLVTRDWCGSTSTCTPTHPPSLPPSPTPTHHATTPAPTPPHPHPHTHPPPPPTTHPPPLPPHPRPPPPPPLTHPPTPPHPESSFFFYSRLLCLSQTVSHAVCACKSTARQDRKKLHRRNMGLTVTSARRPPETQQHTATTCGHRQ